LADDERVRVAVRNNAEWCDAFCRTHGIVGRFDASAWWSATRTPPLYPDAVTLAARTAAAPLLSRIDTSAGCSVKDSFADLELGGEGFEILFRAEWLRRDGPPSSVVPRWSPITTAAELERWEAAWGGSTEEQRLFRAALLENETVAVCAQYEDETVVAGAIANRSSAVIGLSNVFHLGGDLESAWLAGARFAQTRWGAMPVVTYDSGESLAAARAAGFVTVGPLTVWVKPVGRD
jgi:hypothetical protein